MPNMRRLCGLAGTLHAAGSQPAAATVPQCVFLSECQLPRTVKLHEEEDRAQQVSSSGAGAVQRWLDAHTRSHRPDWASRQNNFSSLQNRLPPSRRR